MRELEAESLGELLDERGHLMNLAVRMLGSANDAEDVVQQTYVRWFQLGDEERDAIERPRAWLTTVASRICLNILDSARRSARALRGRVAARAAAGDDGCRDRVGSGGRSARAHHPRRLREHGAARRARVADSR